MTTTCAHQRPSLYNIHFTCTGVQIGFCPFREGGNEKILRCAVGDKPEEIESRPVWPVECK